MWQWQLLFCASENFANDNRHHQQQQQHHHHWLSISHRTVIPFMFLVEGFMNLISLHHVVVVIFENKNNGASKKNAKRRRRAKRKNTPTSNLSAISTYMQTICIGIGIPQVLQFNECLIQWYAHWHGSLSKCRNSNMHHIYNSVDFYTIISQQALFTLPNAHAHVHSFSFLFFSFSLCLPSN